MDRKLGEYQGLAIDGERCSVGKPVHRIKLQMNGSPFVFNIKPVLSQARNLF